jgi:hypothetical protein
MNVSLNLITQPSKGLHNQVVKIVVPYFSVFLRVAGRTILTVEEGGRRWGRSQIFRRRESMVLYKIIQYSLIPPLNPDHPQAAALLGRQP